MARLLFGCVVMLVISAIYCEQEFFTITRESNPTSNSVDLFQVPISNCTKSGIQCKSYLSFATSKACQCSCSYDLSTFGFFHKSWTCIKNTEIRRQSGCTLKFRSEQDSYPLQVFETDHSPMPYVTIPSKGCSIDFTKSKFLACNGTWSQLRLGAGDIPISVYLRERSGRSKNYKYYLYIDSTPPTMKGNVIRLYFKCLSLLSSCVLFKMAGDGKCAFDRPTLITSKPSTIQPSTSTSNVTIVPTKGHDPRKSEKGTSSGVIAAVVIILIIIITIAVLIGYIVWKRKRGERVWLLDQLSDLARKARRRPSLKTYKQQEMKYEDENIYAEIYEQPKITIVEGRSNKPSNGPHQLTIDITRTDGGESQDGPVRQGRASLTDEEGYVVPLNMSQVYEKLKESNDHGRNITEDERNKNQNNQPRTAGKTTIQGQQPNTDEDGYACPMPESPEYNTIEESNRHDSNALEGDKHSRSNTYDQAGQVIATQQENESGTTGPHNDTTKRTRRRPPSPPRKVFGAKA